jgi:hypothetical protein
VTFDEFKTAAAGTVRLREWEMHKERAVTLGLVIPDPSTLLTSLTEASRRFIAEDTERQFRVNMAK